MVVNRRQSWANALGAASQRQCCTDKTSNSFAVTFRRLRPISTLYRATWTVVLGWDSQLFSKTTSVLQRKSFPAWQLSVGVLFPGAWVAPNTSHCNKQLPCFHYSLEDKWRQNQPCPRKGSPQEVLNISEIQMAAYRRVTRNTALSHIHLSPFLSSKIPPRQLTALCFKNWHALSGTYCPRKVAEEPTNSKEQESFLFFSRVMGTIYSNLYLRRGSS